MAEAQQWWWGVGNAFDIAVAWRPRRYHMLLFGGDDFVVERNSWVGRQPRQ